MQSRKDAAMEREIDVRPVHRDVCVDGLSSDEITADDVERIVGYAGEPSESVSTPETLAAALAVIGA